MALSRNLSLALSDQNFCRTSYEKDGIKVSFFPLAARAFRRYECAMLAENLKYSHNNKTFIELACSVTASGYSQACIKRTPSGKAIVSA